MRSKISQEEMDSKVGKILTEDDFNILLTRTTKVLKPDGSPLAIYLPGAISPEMRAEVYPTLHELRMFQSHNRGKASGYRRVGPKHGGPGRTSTSSTVASAIIGSFDP